MGPGGCGKSALATRILARRFITEYCPVLEDVYLKNITVADVQVPPRHPVTSLFIYLSQVQIHVWDTSEPYGPNFSEHKPVHWTTGAVRDPGRWLEWADAVLLVPTFKVNG